MKRRILLLSMLILVSLAGYCQTDQSWFSQGWSVNLNAGPNLFYGDIEVYNFYPVMNNNSEWRMAYGAMVQKQLSAFFAARGQFLHGQLSGTKRKYDRWFEADVIETSAGLTFNVSSFIWGIKDRKLSVYAMAGVGLTQWRTELKDLQIGRAHV